MESRFDYRKNRPAVKNLGRDSRKKPKPRSSAGLGLTYKINLRKRKTSP